MATGSHAVVREIQTLFHLGAIGALSDAELLEQFLARRGQDAEDAFAAVVGRHGPMVLRVCRRILTDSNDAEDAFQVTFLVLARKARVIARREQLANWLYGVAVRSAKEVRKSAARRRAREGPVEAIARALSPAEDQLDELRAVIDDELSRLPDPFRAAVVLCDLEGKTHNEAALILGVPIGTVSSRVSRGRSLLRQRLARRGLDIAEARLAIAQSNDANSFALPPALVASTTRAAARFAMDGTLAGSVPAYISALTEGVLKAMLIAKLMSKGVVIAAFLSLSIGAAAVGLVAYGRSGADIPPSDGPFLSNQKADDEWSWIDHIKNADQLTRERLKRCAISATVNFAAIKTLTFEYELATEAGHVDEKTGKTTSVLPAHSHGTVFWKEGSVSYDVEGNFPFRKPYPSGPVFVLKKPRVFSVLRTRDILAYTEQNPVYGLSLLVRKPPQSAEDWKNLTAWAAARDLDPWLHYAQPFLTDQKLLREFWENCARIESEEQKNGTILLRFLRAGDSDGGRVEIECDRAVDCLPVRVRAGDMRDGKWVVFVDRSHVWGNVDGVWYPSRIVKTAFLGADRRPVKEFDLTIRNARANVAAIVPDSVFTLSGMKIPDGTGGLDKRFDPPRQLFRAGGVVREQRPGEGGVPKNVEEMERQQAEESELWRDADTPRPQAAEPGQTSAIGSLTSSEEYRALLDEFESAHREADRALMAATTEGAQRAAFLEIGRLEWSYAGRFLEIARKYPQDPVAIDAMAGLVAARFTPPEAEQAAEILIRDHLKSDKLLPVYRQLATSLAAWSKAAERLLRAAADNGPTLEDRGQASLSLGLLLKNRADNLRTLRGPEPDPFMKLEAVARSGGHEPVKPTDEEPDALDKEAALFLDRVVGHYSDVKGRDGKLAERAAKELFRLRELAVGKPAPEIEGEDVDGKAFRLSDYRGKVVVVGFSGNWCGPCRAMYPHERELAERMKGRPFALLAVNTDDDKETLRKSLASGEITWRCWWEGGQKRPNCDRWRTDSFPMFYVLDPNGIIRAKDVRGKAIDEVVDRLVQNLESGVDR